MRSTKSLQVIILLIILGSLLIVINGPGGVTNLFGSSPGVEISATPSPAEDNSKPIAACSLDAKDFPDGTAGRRLSEEQARLITIDDFHAEKLNNNRAIYIYLPPGYYENRSQSYPVLYVQDGKGAFYLSDWSQESLSLQLKADELIRGGRIEELIIIGISNAGDQRMSEYAHWNGVENGVTIEGNGVQYEDFIINEIKPFIETNFRVLTGRENTGLMGASIGGLVSFNMGLRHPEMFSKVALQSPYLGWGKETLLAKIKEGEYRGEKHLKIWMDMSVEEQDFIGPMQRVIDALIEEGYRPDDELTVYMAPEGRHSEASWGERVDKVLICLYGKRGN